VIDLGARPIPAEQTRGKQRTDVEFACWFSLVDRVVLSHRVDSDDLDVGRLRVRASAALYGALTLACRSVGQ
jgi:hypothetical protein